MYQYIFIHSLFGIFLVGVPGQAKPGQIRSRHEPLIHLASLVSLPSRLVAEAIAGELFIARMYVAILTINVFGMARAGKEGEGVGEEGVGMVLW